MGFIGKLFAKQGELSATHPCTSIFLGVICILIGVFGFINFQSTVSLPSHKLALGQRTSWLPLFLLYC
jgi:hypothetical protein